MGSSEFTSRYTAQVTEKTAAVPAGVVVTRPLVAETLPAAGLPADRPQAEPASPRATAAATAVMILVERAISPPHAALPRYRKLRNAGRRAGRSPTSARPPSCRCRRAG